MYKKMDYDTFVIEGIIRPLPELEKEAYLDFHKEVWKNDFELGKFLIDKNPRWAIIAGYYAMHNLAKFALAKLYDIKISGKFAHVAVVEAVRKFFGDKLADILDYARKERAKSQYYTFHPKDYSEKAAMQFFLTVVEPFIEEVIKIVGEFSRE